MSAIHPSRFWFKGGVNILYTPLIASIYINFNHPILIQNYSYWLLISVKEKYSYFDNRYASIFSNFWEEIIMFKCFFFSKRLKTHMKSNAFMASATIRKGEIMVHHFKKMLRSKEQTQKVKIISFKQIFSFRWFVFLIS